MKKTNQLFLNAFMIDAIIHIFSIATENIVVQNVSKILLVIFLLAHVVLNFSKNSRVVSFLIIALLFSWAGDVLLIYTGGMHGETYFMLGLVAFLVAHIVYTKAFLKYVYKKNGPGFVKAKPYSIIPFVAYAAILLALLYAHLGTMLLPVIIYTIAITTMAIAALNRYGKTHVYSFAFVFTGAIAFVISDSIIAFNKFYTSIPNASIFIMITYIIAQYLIVTGCMLHLGHENVKA